MIPRSVENAVYGLVSAPVLHLAARHGVLACLVKEGGRTADQVAAERGLDADTVDRLLLVLVATGLAHRDPDGRYALDAEATPYLDAHDPRYLGGFVDHLVTGTPGRLDRLDAYLRHGKAAVDAARPAPYDVFYRDDDSTRDFMDAMWHLSHGVSHELVPLAGLADARHLVDVGGANGPFAVAALQQSPGLRATVFDLPQVGPHLARSARSAGLTDRLDFVAGDFFHDDLPTGDVIALGYVMSNWPDPECRTILRSAHRACAPGGRVLVMDRLFADDRRGPLSTSVMNLLMQVETRGRHRTAAEFVDLLTAVGFVGCEVRVSGSDKHLVIGHKP